jgi:N-acetylglucosaminylphosphatidylinositol deacetylase
MSRVRLGNAEGLGETRKKELVESAVTLGLRSPDDVLVLDSPDFPDSMTITWDTQKVAGVLAAAFSPRPPEATIDVLITFDGRGVSGHPNHISLYNGARAFVAALIRGKGPGYRSPVDLYTLTSVSLLRKYTSGLDVVATLTSWALNVKFKNKEHPAALIFLNGLGSGGGGGVWTAWRAMTTAHKSQMVWFRYLWISFSRYMLMNDLTLEKVRGA